MNILQKIKAIFPPWLNILLVNFIFQRILRINKDVPFSVHFTSRVSCPGKIVIGENVDTSFALSAHCYIQGINGIYIGDGTIFAHGVGIISANHDKTDLAKYDRAKPIRIGKHCWIGMNAVILPGVELGDNVIVGACSVVTKDFPSSCIIAGNPAQTISRS